MARIRLYNNNSINYIAYVTVIALSLLTRMIFQALSQTPESQESSSFLPELAPNNYTPFCLDSC